MSAPMTILAFLGRIIFGGFFLSAGIGHFRKVNMLASYAGARGVPAPKAATLGTGLLLLLGGLSVITGVWPRLGIACLALFLLPTSFLMHNYWKDTDPGMRQINQVQFGKNLALFGAALALLAVPLPWPMSIHL